MLNLRKLTSVMLVAGLMAAVGAAQATTISGGLIGGQNTIQDESRESYIDANRDGKFSVGDVIIGYIRISDFQPSGTSANNQVYGVFSQQVAASSAGSIINFEATTVAGLTLNALLGGNANVNANAIAAFYDKPVSYVDIINNVAPGGPTKMQDYLTYIAGGTLRMVAGLDSGSNWIQSTISAQGSAAGVSLGSANATFLSPILTPGVSITNNSGGLTLSYNNTGLMFNAQAAINPILAAVVTADVTLSGSTKGANGNGVLPSPKSTWLSAGAGVAQCSTVAGNQACGFEDKNDFAVDVKVPEPGSLALVGVALLGLGGAVRRKSRAA